MEIKLSRHPIISIDYYELQKHEVIKLATESNPGQIFFNIMLATLPIGVTSLLALLAVKISGLETWKLVLFIEVIVTSFAASFIFLSLWLNTRKNQKTFLEEILNRPVQGPVGDESKELSSIESRELPESKDRMEGKS